MPARPLLRRYGIDGDDGIVQLTDDIQILLLTRLAVCVDLDEA